MEAMVEQQRSLKEQKRKLLDAAGFATDVFAGTSPIQGGIVSEHNEASAPNAGALSGVAPDDSGVDISGIIALGGEQWRKMI